MLSFKVHMKCKNTESNQKPELSAHLKHVPLKEEKILVIEETAIYTVTVRKSIEARYIAIRSVSSSYHRSDPTDQREEKRLILMTLSEIKVCDKQYGAKLLAEALHKSVTIRVQRFISVLYSNMWLV